MESRKASTKEVPKGTTLGVRATFTSALSASSSACKLASSFRRSDSSLSVSNPTSKSCTRVQNDGIKAAKKRAQETVNVGSGRVQ